MHASGMGIHADLVNPADIVWMAKWLVVAEILYAWNLGWTKLSILMMYYRIFHLPYFKKMAWVVGTFVMVWVVTISFLFVFICVPVQKMVQFCPFQTQSALETNKRFAVVSRHTRQVHQPGRNLDCERSIHDLYGSCHPVLADSTSLGIDIGKTREDRSYGCVWLGIIVSRSG